MLLMKSLPAILFGTKEGARRCCLLGSLCSLVVNYVARQKVGGTNLNFLRLAIPNSPTRCLDLAFIVPHVLELSCTADDLRPLYDDVVAEDLAYDPRSGADHGQPSC